MITREDREGLEDTTLAPQAMHAAQSAGRLHPAADEQDAFRTVFQRDRDRIIHSAAFRRLSHKTQVFIIPDNDHYRTRLTHTLEVAQISRTIARALALNEDLTEAVALGHDLGHTPFGHMGEDALSYCLALRRGLDPALHPALYQHNRQSLRVVDVIENHGRGLNLTHEVRDGILHHTGEGRAQTLEGRVVALADRIAYVNHDLDDAIRAGIVTADELPASSCDVLGDRHAQRIATLVTDLITESSRVGDIRMTPRVEDAMMELRAFLENKVYVKADEQEGKEVFGLVCALFEYYMEHVDEVPEEYHRISDKDETVVVDSIASMTDRYALAAYDRISGT